MDKLIIEVGKFYKTRNGMKIRIYAVDGYYKYPIHGAILWDEDWEVESWDKDGLYYGRERECKLDIVSEWEELTMEEINEISERLKNCSPSIIDYYLIISEKLKEKNYKPAEEE